MRLYDHLLLELRATEPTGLNREEVLVNFALTPYYAEKVLLFGSLVCLDSFLFVLTILPLRWICAVWSLVVRRNISIKRRGDFVKGLIAICTFVLLLQLNTSKVYHGIRGQAGIKLFVMYSVLEIADKFCCAIGQDILETLVSLPTVVSARRTLLLSSTAIGYTFSHSFVLVWQVVTLNVAVNSYSNALLTLMLTSHFGEIKAAVFKNFDRETLFQLTCIDITQRFQLFVLILVISARNLFEAQYTGLGAIAAQLGPAFMVLCSMVIVDWLKHAYIARFNNIRPRAVYSEFLSILVRDFIEHRQLSSHHLMTKCTGVPMLPLAIVCMRMLAKMKPKSFLNVAFAWLTLLFIKLVLGVCLADYTTAYAAAKLEPKKKEDLDKVTPFSMPNIGSSQD